MTTECVFPGERAKVRNLYRVHSTPLDLPQWRIRLWSEGASSE